MVEAWLERAAADYNRVSFDRRDGYPATIHLPLRHLQTIIEWAFQSLPDEILVGFDADGERPHRSDIDEAFEGDDRRFGLFQGEGLVLGEPHLVNRGDSYTVHHVPEEWVDELFAVDRGSRGGRFTHWLHTHPNAVAIPSEADADAAQYTDGIDMILGIEFTPEGALPWFEDAEGVRRRLEPAEVDRMATDRRGWGSGRTRRSTRPILGRAPTGHRIHGLELISFHRTGVGINVVLVDDEGWPVGWNS